MKHLIEEAFRVAIRTEMNSYKTYRSAAIMMPDGSGKNILERLAEEELKIIEEITRHCPFPLPEAEKLDLQQGQSPRTPPKESPERKLSKQLRMAMVDKHCSIEKYMIFAASFKEPGVCKVFELALDMSRNLFDLITQAYNQAELRLHRPGLDRRRKRTHFRPVSRPQPNKHTEVFISLQDTGRSTLF